MAPSLFSQYHVGTVYDKEFENTRWGDMMAKTCCVQKKEFAFSGSFLRKFICE
jgi:hypothetical protein